MIEQVPHVDFYVASTISAMNVLHVLDFHREWVELGLVKAKDWNVNLCQSPDWYRVDIFPDWFKKQIIIPAYQRHIEWLDPQDPLRRATNGYRSLVNLMNSQENNQFWPSFVEHIAQLDVVRNENFWETFPEYKDLL
jgi:hypothetical protein